MAIDPRIRARRVAVRRAEGRRRLRFLLVVGGFVLLAIGAWGLTRTPLLDLDKVRVDGVDGRNADVVKSTAALETGTAMFDLDLGAAESEVASLPWVREAVATRDWPGTVVITVDPRVGVAEIGLADSVYVVDAEGVLIAEAPPESGLPRIANEVTAGLGEIDATAVAALPVTNAISDDLMPWIESVVVLPEPNSAGRPMLQLDLIGDAVVRLTTSELIDDKLEAVRSILNSAELACMAEIDVAVPDLTTVTRDSTCAETSDDEAN